MAEKENLTTERVSYSPTVPLGGGLVSAGKYPVAHANDIAVDNSTGRLIDFIPIILTQEEYNIIYNDPINTHTFDVLDNNGNKIGTRDLKYDENQIYYIKLEYSSGAIKTN